MELSLILLYWSIVSYDVTNAQPPAPSSNNGANTGPSSQQRSSSCQSVGGGNQQQASPGLITCDVTDFSVAFAEQAPYLYLHPRDGDYTGIAHGVMASVVSTCCGSAHRLCYDDDMRLARSIEESMTSSHHIAFPVAKTSLTHIAGVDGYKFLPVMETQGIFSISKDFGTNFI